VWRSEHNHQRFLRIPASDTIGGIKQRRCVAELRSVGGLFWHRLISLAPDKCYRVPGFGGEPWVHGCLRGSFTITQVIASSRILSPKPKSLSRHQCWPVREQRGRRAHSRLLAIGFASAKGSRSLRSEPQANLEGAWGLIRDRSSARQRPARRLSRLELIRCSRGL
jgi:hypothetical protein